MDKIELIPDILKDHILCWYPSSGSDFYAVNHWSAGKGNSINPTFFIYTDIRYDDLRPHSIKYDDIFYWSCIRRNEYLPVTVYPKIPGLPMFSDFDDCKDYISLNSDFLLKIIRASFSSKYESWSITHMDDDITDFAEDLGINIDNNTMGILFKNKINNTYLLLLQMYNQAFYNFCVSNSISIPCLMVRRPFDNFIFDKKLSVAKLKTTELCISEQDTCYFNFPGKYQKSEQFMWSSDDTYDDSAYFICLQTHNSENT